MRRVAVLLGFVLFLLLPTSVSAAECQFVLGFATLRDLIGNEVVGECLENEHHNEIGDSVQQTTGGLLVWRKADNWTAFTDGYHSWVNGPNGLEQRLNVELLPWEAHNWIDTLPWVKDGISNTETRQRQCPANSGGQVFAGIPSLAGDGTRLAAYAGQSPTPAARSASDRECDR